MRPRDLVEIAWETPLGAREWRPAIVLCVMPRLLIVEYSDGKRHCLPREHARPRLVPLNMGGNDAAHR